MKTDERYPWIIAICLPLFVLVAFNVQPVPVQISRSWQTIQSRVVTVDGLAKKADAALRVADWQPWRTDLWVVIAKQYSMAKDWDQAIEYFQAARQAGTLSLENNLELADAYEAVGKPADAYRIWQEVIATQTLPGTIFQKALGYSWSQKDWTTAQQIASKWLAVDETQAEPHYRLGLLNLQTNPDSAEKHLLKAVSLDGSYLARVSGLIKALHESSTITQPEYDLVRTGRALGGVGEWALAKVVFEQAVQENPQYAEALAYLGECKAQLNEGGMREMQMAVALNPDSVSSKALLALSYQRLDEPDRALVYLHEIVLQEPLRAVWHAELGNTLAELGDLVRAGEEYQKAVELEPDQAEWRYQLAVFSLTNSIDVENLALPSARKALQLEPQNVHYMDLLGWVLFSLGDRRSAQRFFEDAIRQDPSYATTYLHLGQLFLDEGNSEQAYVYLKQAQLHAEADGEIQFISTRLLERYFDSSN